MEWSQCDTIQFGGPVSDPDVQQQRSYTVINIQKLSLYNDCVMATTK